MQLQPLALSLVAALLNTITINNAPFVCTFCDSHTKLIRLKYWLKVCVKYVPVTGPVVAQRVGRGIALLFHDRGTRRGWVVSSTPRPHFTHWKDPVPILQEAEWAPGPVWRGAENLSPPAFDPRTVQHVVSRYTD